MAYDAPGGGVGRYARPAVPLQVSSRLDSASTAASRTVPTHLGKTIEIYHEGEFRLMTAHDRPIRPAVCGGRRRGA
eukprot:5074970-Prymnesium_polylepis.1